LTDVVEYSITEESLNLAKLVDICGMFQALSADDERGFSRMSLLSQMLLNTKSSLNHVID